METLAKEWFYIFIGGVGVFVLYWVCRCGVELWEYSRNFPREEENEV